MFSAIRFSFLFILCLTFIVGNASAQTFTVSGNLTDSLNQTAVIGAYIKLAPIQDTTKAVYASSDVNGKFALSGVSPQRYRVTITNVAYSTVQRTITVRDTDVLLGTIFMKESQHILKEVQIVGQIQQAQQKGDTTQFNAAAFKTNPDASTEDLIQKMPGITVTNGEVKAQGETVQRVLVDGKPFFGNDPTAALRNLPAEVVDKIEVFDRLSDQAQFSGFDDGSGQKTINIITRPDRNRGQFGKAFAGVGSDGRYTAGGSINLFGNGHRISAIGLSNNINQQNFSNEDIAGVMGSTGGGGGRGGMGGGGGNFMVGSQNGITKTNAFGLNYSGTWGKKTDVTGSYFFNNANNENRTITSRETFLGSNNQIYQDTSVTGSNNYNHRLNFRLEHKANARNTIILSPSISFQNNENIQYRSGATDYADGTPLNSTKNERITNTTAFNFNNSLLWRYQFAKPRRTFSIDVGTAINNRESDGSLQSRNLYFTSLQTPGDTIDQRSVSLNKGTRLSANANFTEPVGKNAQLQFGYNVAVSNNNSKSETNHWNETLYNYSNIDTLLSNTFDNRYVTQRTGLTYRIRSQNGLTFAVGADYQHAGLYSEQSFPRFNEVENTFSNILPNMMLTYRTKSRANLRFFYRTSTQEPSINQLQNVINNSNPLFMSAGNPDLKQSYAHRLNIRYNSTNANTGHNLFALVSSNITRNTITNSTIIAQEAMLLPNGLLLQKGAQFTSPVNIDGNWDLRGLVSYGMPIKPIKVNVNLNTGLTYMHTPGLINQIRNTSNTYAISQGLVLSSNINQNLDFTLSYNGNYNVVRNSIQRQSNNNYYTQGLGGRVNWIFGKGFVVSTDVSNQSYRGLGDGFNQTYTLWNASVGKKLFKNNRGELKFTMFDILGQNNSISRSVTETYQQDVINRVLTRYGMLTFTYNLRNFGAKNATPSAPNRGDNNMPEGGFPGRGNMPSGGFPGGGFPGGGSFR